MKATHRNRPPPVHMESHQHGEEPEAEMNALEIFGAVATAMSFLAMGCSAGVWYQRRRQADEALGGAFTRVRDALASVDFQELAISPQQAASGSEITLHYTIESHLRVPVEVWLGADIPLGSNSWFYDVSQDKTVFLDPGRHVYTRSLTLAKPLPVGDWTLSAGIWFGKRSTPEQSMRFAVRMAAISVTGR